MIRDGIWAHGNEGVIPWRDGGKYKADLVCDDVREIVMRSRPGTR